MSDQSNTCGYCGKTGTDLQRCSKCHVIYYCGRGCQRIDWTDHKLVCSKPDERKKNDKAGGKQGSKVQEQGNSSSHQDAIICTAVRDDGLMEENMGGFGEGAEGGDEKTLGKCHKCGVDDCSLKCGRCREVYYCSKQCQKKDWRQHKWQCLPMKDKTLPGKGTSLTNEEQRAIDKMKMRQVRFSRSREQCQNMGMNMQAPEMQRFLPKLSPGQLKIHDRPLGSLVGALSFARRCYPYWDIIDSFGEIPPEFLPYPMSFFVQRSNYVVVAFMFMYHDHLMRHGVYLKDSEDKITHVEFYLDNDEPWPYFTYSQIKPENYILLENPVIHHFMDGQIGIRVDDPSTVKIYNPHNLLHNLR